MSAPWALGAAHLAQAGVYLALLGVLPPDMVVERVAVWGACLAQAIATIAVRGERERPRALGPVGRTANAATLALVLFAYARVGAQAVHVLRTFGHIAGDQAWEALATAVLALPWLILWPALRCPPSRWSAAVLALGALPLGDALRPSTPMAPGWDAARAEAAAVEIAGRIRAGGGAWPELPPPVTVLVTPVDHGHPEATRCARAGSWDALGGLAPPGPGQAVVVEVAERHLSSRWLVTGTDTGDEPCPPAPFLRKARFAAVLPGLRADRAPGRAVRYRSAAAQPGGVVVLSRGWARAPALGEASLREAVDAGARFLVRGMRNGRFTYVVRGPSGEAGPGYNLPRHAGTAWYLARAGEALGDPGITAAALAAVGWLERSTRPGPDGRLWIQDPYRDDGRTWIGTTALAVLAAVAVRAPVGSLEGWLVQLATSVDARGRVCGDMVIADHRFGCGSSSAYGQAQVMLALAVAERDLERVPAVVPAALDRTLAFLGSGAYLGAAAPLVVGDEHWMCLVAHALPAVRADADPGVRSARAICEAWLRGTSHTTPSREGHLPHTGAAGGLAEAMAAHAHDVGSAAWRARALALADGFLVSQYHPADAPFLAGAEALVGGLRSGPRELDVQIDTVQHAGCAMLGALALLEGDGPGRFP